MAADGGRIDVHFHSVPPVFREALSGLPAGSARAPAWTPELALEMMDRNDIASAVLSISTPGAHMGDDAKACDELKKAREKVNAADLENLKSKAVLYGACRLEE